MGEPTDIVARNTRMTRLEVGPPAIVFRIRPIAPPFSSA